MKHRYSEADLQEAVKRSVSISGVMSILGIKLAGGSHAHISRRIKAAGYDTSHFQGKAHTGVSRKTNRKDHVELLVKGSSHPGYMLRRALVDSGRAYECSCCQTSEIWQGKPLILHVDHTDGDRTNNSPTNLRFLCPNCHSQTDTFCRKKQT